MDCRHLPKESRPRVPIDECIKGRLYKIDCRNFSFGVYDGKEGFIGIRTKWGSKYLATEFHWDQGPPYGTVHTIIDTGIDIPSEIPLKEYLPVGENTVANNEELHKWINYQIELLEA